MAEVLGRDAMGCMERKVTSNNGLRELSIDEIQSVVGGSTAGCALGWGGMAASAVGVGMALSAAGPVGFMAGFGLGMFGVFSGAWGVAEGGCTRGASHR